MNLRLSLVVSLLLAGCAAAPPPAVVTPASPPPTGAASTPDASQQATAPAITPLPHFDAVPTAPKSCEPYEVSLPKDASCPATSKDELLKLLADALEVPTLAPRDQALQRLEGCEQLDAGVVRALRAELVPLWCADLLVEPWLAAHRDDLSLELRGALVGRGIAAQLSRLASAAPGLKPPFERPAFERFLGEQLGPWVRTQSLAIAGLSQAGVQLTRYGKAQVAVEAGLADLRFTEVLRSVPLPQEFATDKELAEEYANSLEQELEPRKERGRAASLVGMKEFEQLGALRDERIERARGLLSLMWAGRRVDALDGLELPPIVEPTLTTTAGRLTAALPSFYLGMLLPSSSVSEPEVQRALLSRGLPPAFEDDLEARKDDAPAQMLLAQLRLLRARTFWTGADFAAASQAAQRAATLDHQYTDAAALIDAIARAMSTAPRSAAQMMAKGPMLPEGVGDVSALEALARRRGILAPLAAWDAGLISSLLPVPEKAVAHWRAIAERFDLAAKLWGKDRRAARAKDRAAAARATADAIAERLKAAPAPPSAAGKAPAGKPAEKR